MMQNNGRRYDNRPDYGRQGGNPRYSRQEEPALPVPDFPEDYVEYAETVMEQLIRSRSGNVTTTKIRKILSLLTDIYNTEILRTEETLTDESITKLQLARIRIVYECGRDEGVKTFAEKTHLLPWLKDVGSSREKAIRYTHYVEALVAYHKFFGGKES